MIFVLLAGQQGQNQADTRIFIMYWMVHTLSSSSGVRFLQQVEQVRVAMVLIRHLEFGPT
ncbi:MAG: hypothetical protein A2024_12200 [Candidatus Edwardsbacteria bacterium GWF2_54_11]|uniref:Uncharacterized protein n=1 Tax=Candidatus Edwardsbacteria bacterium GWF2_54_11 TaxID=1817851 RepID=A0A1F5REB2_9BACT|nr:MAG: hypothetical protein A2024_12200 [Candidatus Edwardsbacteria bacterium GWF2_54_11]